MESAEFENLYQSHVRELRSTIQRIVQEGDAAEDVLQDVFIRAWNQRDKLSEVQNLRGWLTRIAVNLSLNALRSRNRKREILLGDRGVRRSALRSDPLHGTPAQQCCRHAAS